MSSGGDSRRTKRSSSRDRPSSHNKNHSRSQRQSRSRSNSRSSSSSSKSSPQSQRRRKSKGRSKSPNLRRIGNFTSSQDPRDVDSRVFIGNLNTSSLRSGEIEKLFLEYGVVTGVSLHKGFAFVQFTNRSCAEAAVKAYHGSIIAGSRVDCNLVNEGKMGDRHRSRASMDRDRGSRESSRLRDYDRYDAYDRPYERERRSRERSPLRPDPYDDRYRDPPPIRRGDRYPDDPFDRRDPYGRRDEYYRDRREGDRYLRDERDDPYRDPYRRDSYEYRDRDRDRERDRDGFERGRPTYHDYPEPVEPVQRPIDCEVIVVNRQQREYAESVERSLKQVGLVVDITYLGTDISLAQALDDVSRRGVLYAIIVTSQHALHRSVTLNILHGTPQETLNISLDKVAKS